MAVLKVEVFGLQFPLSIFLGIQLQHSEVGEDPPTKKRRTDQYGK